MSSREIRNYFKGQNNIKQDYYKKNLQNPFYNKRSHGHKKTFSGGKIILIPIFIFVVIGLWVFLFSSLFVIKNIETNGLTRVASSDVLNIIETQISEKRCLFLSQKNIFVFNKNEVVKNLLEKFGFRNVSIKTTLKGDLKIDISEREYAFIWGENGNYYYIDKDAHIVNKIASNSTPLSNLSLLSVENSLISSSTATTTDLISNEQNQLDIQKEALREVKKNNKNSYPIIDNLYTPIIKNDIVDIDRVYFDFVEKINKTIGDPNCNLSISRFFIDSDIDTLKVELNSGLLIYFSVKQNHDNQINSLLVLKDKLNKIIKKKVDLRYGDRIYYE